MLFLTKAVQQVAAGAGLVLAAESGNPIAMAAAGANLMAVLNIYPPWGTVASIMLSILATAWGEAA